MPDNTLLDWIDNFKKRSEKSFLFIPGQKPYFLNSSVYKSSHDSIIWIVGKQKATKATLNQYVLVALVDFLLAGPLG